LNPYHALVTISWTRFYAIIGLCYLGVNLAFAIAYYLCGPGALQGTDPRQSRFTECFFFSVQTIATIGYGRINPDGLAANILVAIEAVIGLMGFALATGLAFARFSQPTAKILFSDKAVVAPYAGRTGFMFRIANEREKQLVDLHAQVVFSRREEPGGVPTRRFYQLPLEREGVALFPLHWVVVHAIGERSPLYGLSHADLADSDAEFLVLLTGYDETSAQVVHARSSYKPEEVVVGARFKDMFVADAPIVSVDLRKIHDIEPMELPGVERPALRPGKESS
jgi:inward rectifier potassium channel